MNVRYPLKQASIVTIAALTLLTMGCYGASAEAGDGGESSPWTEAKVPWALGIVLPDGTLLEGGLRLDWSEVFNITVVVKLPNIAWTDNTIYMILSAMDSYGEVVQVAAGLNPDGQGWLVYAFYINDIEKYPQTYIWVTNRSQPRMMPNERVALSIHTVEEGGWGYTVQNLITGDRSAGLFPASKVKLKKGGQEVFALESYTSNPMVFKEMGEAVLEGIYINGFRVEGQGYVFGSWDLIHRPLFIVGGGSTPSFIAVIQSLNQYRWVYSPAESWEPSSTPLYVGLAYALAILSIVIIAATLIKKLAGGAPISFWCRLLRSPIRPIGCL